jgi:hypothetical protein
MTGEELYAQWRTYMGGGDEAWSTLQSEVRASWDLLAAWVTKERQACAADALRALADAMQDAWERREQRRCHPSTT